MIFKDISDRELYEKGYVLFPDPCDVFGFPDEFNRTSWKPFLSLKSEIGWLTFTVDPWRFLIRHGRLFSEEEWEEYQNFEDSHQEDLKFFWSCHSEYLPEKEEELDIYYRTLFMVRRNTTWENLCMVSHDQYIHDIQKYFDETQTKYREGEIQINTGGDESLRDWFEQNLYRYLWQYTVETRMFYWPEGHDFLSEAVRRDRDAYLERQSKREYGKKGLHCLETRRPTWFQGHDKTPDGEDVCFAGEIWTDYVGAYGSKLLYLFYNRKTHMQMEDYDYD